MICSNCGTHFEEEGDFCTHCGTRVAGERIEPEGSKKDVAQQRRKTVKLVPKLLTGFAVAVVAVIVLSVCIVNKANSVIEGKYVDLTGRHDGNPFVYELKQEDEGFGTFEYYCGDTVYDKGERLIWSRNGDLLKLRKVHSDCYFLIVDRGLIELEDEDDEPAYADYVAPRGSRFNYEIGDYEFYKDGTAYNGYDYGTYYVENNIIYFKYDGEGKFLDSYSLGSDGNLVTTKKWHPYEYEPVFWIYNKDHITSVYDVFLKE